MNRRLKISFPAFILVAAILACNTPVEQVPPPDEIQTAAALTLQVIFTTSATSTRAVTNTITPLTTQTLLTAGSPTVTITPTYSVPMLTVQESTNCRQAPVRNTTSSLLICPGRNWKLRVVMTPEIFGW